MTIASLLIAASRCSSLESQALRTKSLWLSVELWCQTRCLSSFNWHWARSSLLRRTRYILASCGSPLHSLPSKLSPPASESSHLVPPRTHFWSYTPTLDCLSPFVYICLWQLVLIQWACISFFSPYLLWSYLLFVLLIKFLFNWYIKTESMYITAVLYDVWYATHCVMFKSC